jgi:hypothetical protein
MILGTMLLTAAALLAPAPPENKLTTYVSVGGNYKVLLFPKHKTATRPGGGLTLHIVASELEGKALLVIHADMPISGDEPEEKLRERLDGARDAAITAAGAKELASSKITLAGKYPGCEYSARFPEAKGVLKARIYIVGKRLYQVVAAGPADFIDSADVKKMFDSFEVTK